MMAYRQRMASLAFTNDDTCNTRDGKQVSHIDVMDAMNEVPAEVPKDSGVKHVYAVLFFLF